MKQTPEQILELLSAAKDGKPMQYQSSPLQHWRSCGEPSFASTLSAICSNYEVRVTPEKKRVPLTQEDWAGGTWWVRNNHSEVSISPHQLILETVALGFYTRLGFYRFSDCTTMELMERSRDCKKWSPCYREVEE